MPGNLSLKEWVRIFSLGFKAALNGPGVQNRRRFWEKMSREAHHETDKQAFAFICNWVVGHAGHTVGGLLINISE